MSGARMPNAAWSSWFTQTNPTSTINGNKGSPPLTSPKNWRGGRGQCASTPQIVNIFLRGLRGGMAMGLVPDLRERVGFGGGGGERADEVSFRRWLDDSSVGEQARYADVAPPRVQTEQAVARVADRGAESAGEQHQDQQQPDAGR